jgi:hypothetical protein
MSRSMGSYNQPHEGKSNDWLTPPSIFKALPQFDLDPCASRYQPWRSARRMWTGGGLAKIWNPAHTVWLNPPYGPHVWDWLECLTEHNNGVALVFARTETDWFFKYVWGRSTGLFFFKQRLHFHHPFSGVKARFNAGAPSVLVAYGARCRNWLRSIDTKQLPGKFVPNRPHP